VCVHFFLSIRIPLLILSQSIKVTVRAEGGDRRAVKLKTSEYSASYVFLTTCVLCFISSHFTMQYGSHFPCVQHRVSELSSHVCQRTIAVCYSLSQCVAVCWSVLLQEPFRPREKECVCTSACVLSQLLAFCFVEHICPRTLYTHTPNTAKIYAQKMNPPTLHTHAYHQVSLRQMLDTQDCYLDLVACTNFVQVIKKHIRTRMHTRTRTHTCSRTRTRTRTRTHTHTRTRTCAASIQNSHARTCARAPVERM